MAQLLAPMPARIGVPNVTGYKRIAWHKACADPGGFSCDSSRLSCVNILSSRLVTVIPAAVKRPLTQIARCVADLFSFYAARSVSAKASPLAHEGQPSVAKRFVRCQPAVLCFAQHNGRFSVPLARRWFTPLPRFAKTGALPSGPASGNLDDSPWVFSYTRPTLASSGRSCGCGNIGDNLALAAREQRVDMVLP
jgi:hypothetical protein